MTTEIITKSYLPEKVRQRITLPLCTNPENQAARYNHKAITTIKKIKADTKNRSTASIYTKHHPARDKKLISIPHSNSIAI